jgi:hypothetical protein
MFLVTYRVRSGPSAEENRRSAQAILDLYGKLGELEGTVGHWSAAGGGCLVIDSTLEKVYERTVLFSPYMEFEIQPVLPINDALPFIMAMVSPAMATT